MMDCFVPTNDKPGICHSSPSPLVILNEVKNRTVTKGKPTAEILHFVQNDIFFSFVIFRLFDAIFGVSQ